MPWIMDSFETTDTDYLKYPLTSSSDSSFGDLVDLPEELDKMGIKLVGTKVNVTEEFNVPVNTVKKAVKKESGDVKPKIFAPVVVSDQDSKLHGGRVGLGIQMPKIENSGGSTRTCKSQEFASTGATIFIRLCNQINLLQWTTKKWNIPELKDAYFPNSYEEDEDPVLREVEESIDLDPVVKKENKNVHIDLDDDTKRKHEEVIDLCDDDDEPIAKVQKGPLYRKWTVSDVSKWIKRTDPYWEYLGYDTLMEKANINGLSLEEMSLDTLNTIGITDTEQQTKILACVREMEQ